MARRQRRDTAAPVPAAVPARGLWNAGWLRPAILALAGVLVYANSLPGIFTFDDEVAVVENTSIRELTSALTPPERGEPVAGRPLVNFTFAINYAIHGLDAGGYHVANIALHIVCGLLLFGLVRRTWMLVRAEDGAAVNVAFVCALIWLVHPLLTEAVNYVSQRTELVMAFCYLLTLYAGARAAVGLRPDTTYEKDAVRLKPDTTYENDVVSGFSRTGWLVTSVTACALGMASKETMATAPLMVVLYDRAFLYGSFNHAFRARRTFYLSLASTWVLLAVLIWSGPRWESAGFSTGITVWTYLLNQAVMLAEYLRRAIWPASLVLDYGEPRSLTLPEVASQAALIVVLLIATIVALVRRPRLGFLAAAFFIVLAPTSSVIPIATEVGAERRMYLPLAALVVLAVLAGRLLSQRLRPAVAAMGMAATTAAVCLALGAVTWQRDTEYQDELALWRTTLERWPQARAHRNYATLLKRAGYRNEVIDHLRQSLDGHPEGRYALGFELIEQQRLDEGIEELRRFAREVPSDALVAEARTKAGHALLARARYDEATLEFEAVTRSQPTLSPAWTNLGVAYAQLGDPGRALPALQRAVQLDPRNTMARRNLAAVLMVSGQLEEAAQHAAEATRLGPSDALSRELLEEVRGRQRRSAAP